MFHLNIRKFSVNYHGVKLFNALSQDIRDASSFFSVRRKLKQYLLNQWLSPKLNWPINIDTDSVIIL